MPVYLGVHMATVMAGEEECVMKMRRIARDALQKELLKQYGELAVGFGEVKHIKIDRLQMCVQNAVVVGLTQMFP